MNELPEHDFQVESERVTAPQKEVSNKMRAPGKTIKADEFKWYLHQKKKQK